MPVETVVALKAHLAINVRNVAQSIEFYRKMFGIEPSKVRSGYAKFDVQNPPLNFTLNQVPFKDAGALSHMGIQVALSVDVLSIRQRWADAGLVTRDEMQTGCCYATQDKTWVHDPDGNEWEVFVVLKDNLPEKPGEQAGAACCAPAAARQRRNTPTSKPRVLFLCTGNSARSQMAEGYLRHVAGDEFEPLSAGVEPKGLNPLAVEAMNEIGIDISQQTSKDVREFLGQAIPYVITVCDNARQRCPIFPRTYKFLHWSLQDPAEATGSHEERLAVFRRVRDEIRQRVERELLKPAAIEK